MGISFDGKFDKNQIKIRCTGMDSLHSLGVV